MNQVMVRGYMAVNDNNLFGFVGYTYDNYWQAIASYEYTLTHNSAYRHLQGKSLEEWVNGIGPAGYCNEPGYSDHLWNMINQWDLA